ncbi:hypothetical protein GOBAR_AA30587 [Gossypium barbadense]|uniref:Uncharacterized protein n=1 Tax=Gossypium barbadense TaxID=3634 RepID=A0A2P5WG85_GOSBA|nr:hypothetical protein GOBAR_AA30587 [Gossypium barbadense]
MENLYYNLLVFKNPFKLIREHDLNLVLVYVYDAQCIELQKAAMDQAKRDQVAEQKWNCESTTNDYAVTNSCSSSSTVVQNCESTTNDNVFTQSCSSSSSQSFTYYSNP